MPLGRENRCSRACPAAYYCTRIVSREPAAQAPAGLLLKTPLPLLLLARSSRRINRFRTRPSVIRHRRSLPAPPVWRRLPWPAPYQNQTQPSAQALDSGLSVSLGWAVAAPLSGRQASDDSRLLHPEVPTAPVVPGPRPGPSRAARYLPANTYADRCSITRYHLCPSVSYAYGPATTTTTQNLLAVNLLLLSSSSLEHPPSRTVVGHRVSPASAPPSRVADSIRPRGACVGVCRLLALALTVSRPPAAPTL